MHLRSGDPTLPGAKSAVPKARVAEILLEMLHGDEAHRARESVVDLALYLVLEPGDHAR